MVVFPIKEQHNWKLIYSWIIFLEVALLPNPIPHWKEKELQHVLDISIAVDGDYLTWMMTFIDEGIQFNEYDPLNSNL